MKKHLTLETMRESLAAAKGNGEDFATVGFDPHGRTVSWARNSLEGAKRYTAVAK